jgi:phosphoglycerol transferase
LFLILFYFAVFVNKRFGDISFEQLLYNITNTKGANFDIVLVGVFFIAIRLVIIFGIITGIYLLFKYLKIELIFNINIKNKTRKFSLFKKSKIKSIILLVIFITFILYKTIDLLNINEYVKNQLSKSTIFEEYYVDGSKVKLEFPKKKRNLIYIYAESMESTNASKANGGHVEKSYIPNLEKLALNNINFSNTNNIGGSLQLNNTSWTMAALVAHTAGVPLKLSIDGNLYKNYSESLPGVYNLGDILRDNGYNNYFMIGSDAEFGDRKDYFEKHGKYIIYDYYYAKYTDLIDDDYYVWWGYEDKKLFKYAKEKILEAAKSDIPFNFTILTVDTHFTDGYMDSSCKEVFDSKYANALYCSDQKISSFVKWLMKQDFYEDTTIIISGDHLTMQNDFYMNLGNYQRTMYNTIINSPIEPINEKYRYFSAFDMFPTTLASLGVKIEGDRLGLGVNLFSEEKTLIEELGYTYMQEELAKKSFFYDNVLLGDTYYEMQDDLESLED